MRWPVFLLLAATVSPAFADASKLKPAGWSANQSRYTDSWTFTSPDESSEAQVMHFDKLALEELGDMAADHMRPYDTEEIERDRPVAKEGALIYTVGYRHEDTGAIYVGMAIAAPHKLGGTLTCYIHAPLLSDQSPPEIAPYIARCAEFAKAGTPYDAEMAKVADQRAAIAAVPVKAGKGRAVEAVVLDLYYTYGVGGMILPDYRPIVLFKDGIACKCLDEPVADADPSAKMKTDPDAVTRWTRNGKNYVMSWPGDKEPKEVAADFERPLVYGKDARLEGYWTRISGGGNTALGGDTMVSATNSFQFYKDGTFENSATASASVPGVFTGSSRGKSGKYRIDGDALTLSFANGDVRRTSLYHSDGTDPVLWIGGNSFASR